MISEKSVLAHHCEIPINGRPVSHHWDFTIYGEFICAHLSLQRLNLPSMAIQPSVYLAINGAMNDQPRYDRYMGFRGVNPNLDLIVNSSTSNFYPSLSTPCIYFLKMASVFVKKKP